MADLIETLTSLQEAIFLGTVVGMNRTEHSNRDFLASWKTTVDTILPEYPDDRRHPARIRLRTGYPAEGGRVSPELLERPPKSDHLDVIVLDDDPQMCSLIAEILEGFYAWGSIHAFTDFNEALTFCKRKKLGVAIFILDVYLDKRTAFDFLDQISEQCAWAAEDTVIISGNASDDIVNMCVASNIAHLLEKPIKVHALKLTIRAIVDKYLRFAKRFSKVSYLPAASRGSDALPPGFGRDRLNRSAMAHI
ncbi:MAG: response regulator [Deltaproteobacteria bacterium]|nr:response regulator [Deltaproteobacteria bacterium]